MTFLKRCLIPLYIVLAIIGLAFYLFRIAPAAEKHMKEQNEFREAQQERIAKQPTMILKGTYDGKPIEIEVYEPTRK